MKNTFADLSKIDVTKHLEEKQGLSYLQWMGAWSIAKDYDPKANYVIEKDVDGNPYFNDPVAGAFVGVKVTINDEELTEYLPVLDFRNKAVIGEKLNVFDINSAIKRCLVKCLAMHGLGAQVYIDGSGDALDLGRGLSKKTKAPAKPKGPTPATSKRKMF